MTLLEIARVNRGSTVSCPLALELNAVWRDSRALGAYIPARAPPGIRLLPSPRTFDLSLPPPPFGLYPVA